MNKLQTLGNLVETWGNHVVHIRITKIEKISTFLWMLWLDLDIHQVAQNGTTIAVQMALTGVMCNVEGSDFYLLASMAPGALALCL
jgi:hypothetical protein